MNKRAIELSINFIVLFILAMAMFAAGISIARKIFSEADVMKQKLSEQQKDELEAILRQGSEKVKVTFTRKDIPPGGNDVFGIGIRNDFATETEFYVETNLDAAFRTGGTTICDDDTAVQCLPEFDNWLYLEDGPLAGPIPIPSNGMHVQDIFVIVPKDAEKGTYIFNMRVCTGTPCDNSNGYDTVKKLNVIV